MTLLLILPDDVLRREVPAAVRHPSQTLRDYLTTIYPVYLSTTPPELVTQFIDLYEHARHRPEVKLLFKLTFYYYYFLIVFFSFLKFNKNSLYLKIKSQGHEGEIGDQSQSRNYFIDQLIHVSKIIVTNSHGSIVCISHRSWKIIYNLLVSWHGI